MVLQNIGPYFESVQQVKVLPHKFQPQFKINRYDLTTIPS